MFYEIYMWMLLFLCVCSASNPDESLFQVKRYRDGDRIESITKHECSAISNSVWKPLDHSQQSYCQCSTLHSTFRKMDNVHFMCSSRKEVEERCDLFFKTTSLDDVTMIQSSTGVNGTVHGYIEGSEKATYYTTQDISVWIDGQWKSIKYLVNISYKQQNLQITNFQEFKGNVMKVDVSVVVGNVNKQKCLLLKASGSISFNRICNGKQCLLLTKKKAEEGSNNIIAVVVGVITGVLIICCFIVAVFLWKRHHDWHLLFASFCSCERISRKSDATPIKSSLDKEAIKKTNSLQKSQYASLDQRQINESQYSVLQRPDKSKQSENEQKQTDLPTYAVPMSPQYSSVGPIYMTTEVEYDNDEEGRLQPSGLQMSSSFTSQTSTNPLMK